MDCQRVIARWMALATLATAFTGCASTPSPVPVAGSPEALLALAGNWSGTYTGTESGRNGSISFSLRAGDTTAFGDVLMIPRGYEHHDVWTDRERHTIVAPQHPAILMITFVRVSGDRVSGMLDPYTDPDCECTVVTTFSGRVNRNTLSGTFVTRVPGTAEVRTGTWSVARKTEGRNDLRPSLRVPT